MGVGNLNRPIVERMRSAVKGVRRGQALVLCVALCERWLYLEL